MGERAVRTPDVGSDVTPDGLAALARRLAAAGDPLRAVPVEARIAAIDRAARRWLAPASPWHTEAVTRVASATGYAQSAVAHGLTALWEALRAPALQAVARAEWPADPARREPTAPIGSTPSGTAPPRVRPAASARDRLAPRLALHALAGNVPGAGIFGIVAALLCGVPSLVKAARREPHLAGMVARSLTTEDAHLGDAITVVPWRGGDATLDAVAIAHADVVLAYGRTASLDGLAAHHPRRLFRFGPRVSVALIAAEALDRRTAATAALQVALFDQQGCLSPQLILVEDGRPALADAFAAALATELATLETTMPRAPLALAEAAAGWRHLEEQRWRRQEGAAVQVHGEPQGGWSVVVDRSGALPASPLNRHVVVVPIATLSHARATLTPLAGTLEAIAYAGPQGRLAELLATAGALGAHRLCSLARLQTPPFAWRQSGHGRLAPFLGDEGALPPALDAAEFGCP